MPVPVNLWVGVKRSRAHEYIRERGGILQSPSWMEPLGKIGPNPARLLIKIRGIERKVKLRF